ncbi:hypothetical protein GOV10_05555, partial [Candidatus Woesearchaeota archaeon]|nr:hypothetical protein [Candidatus Woesearchaeota archaeon]
MHHSHLLVVLLVPLLVMSVVFASDAVTTYPSGIFRGSMSHVVDLGALEEGGVLIPSVNAGDFISFRKPGRAYAREQDHEPGKIYIRSFDRGGQGAVKYDFETDKYKTLLLEENLLLDVDFDGNNDLALQFSSVDLRSGSFMVSLPAQEKNKEENVEGQTNTTESVCDVAC